MASALHDHCYDPSLSCFEKFNLDFNDHDDETDEEKTVVLPHGIILPDLKSQARNSDYLLGEYMRFMVELKSSPRRVDGKFHVAKIFYWEMLKKYWHFSIAFVILSVQLFQKNLVLKSSLHQREQY